MHGVVTPDPDGEPLGAEEAALLAVLVEHAGRVMARRDLARRIGIADRAERRCDSLVVGLRRRLGGDAIVTVRSRGWMLQPDAVPAAIDLLPGSSTSTR